MLLASLFLMLTCRLDQTENDRIGYAHFNKENVSLNINKNTIREVSPCKLNNFVHV